MIKPWFYFFFLSQLAFAAYSCTSIEGPQAAFIDIESAECYVSEIQGVNDHTINHVEIFFEGFSIGYYELPVQLAVIPTKSASEIAIYPAIPHNGQRLEVSTYKVMSAYQRSQAFEIGKTYKITPTFKYDKNTVFEIISDFEDAIFLEDDLDYEDSTFVELNDKDSANGNVSLLFTSENGPAIIAGQSGEFGHPDNQGRPMYVEVTFRCNTSFKMGVLANKAGVNSFENIFTFTPRKDWTKVYIELSDVLSTINADSYKLYFGFNSGVVSDKYAMIDDLRLSYLK